MIVDHTKMIVDHTKISTYGVVKFLLDCSNHFSMIVNFGDGVVHEEILVHKTAAVWGLGFGVSGSGFGVWGLGFGT